MCRLRELEEAVDRLHDVADSQRGFNGYRRGEADAYWRVLGLIRGMLLEEAQDG